VLDMSATQQVEAAVAVEIAEVAPMPKNAVCGSICFVTSAKRPLPRLW
jgi:hypothetical protein